MTMKQAATCAICDEPIYVDPEAAAGWAGLMPLVERAAAEHLAKHPAPIVEQFRLRKRLDQLPPHERPAAVKRVYEELLKFWGDQDNRGVYSIDEALGTPAMFGLWHSANACTWPHCRH